MSDNVAHALGGACGGMAALALTYPLITLSTRNQVKDPVTFKQILKQEGLKGFFSGVESALLGIALTQGVYYYFYEWTKGVLTKDSITTLQSMMAGAIAGSATCIVTNPIWVINTRLTVAKKSDNTQGFFEIARSIYQKEGLEGFFKGIFPALVLVSNPIIQYAVFEKLREKLVAFRNLTAIDFFLLGAVSKLCATGITYPYIVIKSRMQVNKQQRTGIFDAFKRILKEEGLAGFYKGINAKITQSVLNSAFLFLFKEEFFKLAITLLVALKMRQRVQ